MLAADQPLAEELARRIDEGRQAGVSVIVSGDRSVGAGRDISGTNTTGDGNIVNGS